MKYHDASCYNSKMWRAVTTINFNGDLKTPFKTKAAPGRRTQHRGIHSMCYRSHHRRKVWCDISPYQWCSVWPRAIRHASQGCWWTRLTSSLLHTPPALMLVDSLDIIVTTHTASINQPFRRKGWFSAGGTGHSLQNRPRIIYNTRIIYNII